MDNLSQLQPIEEELNQQKEAYRTLVESLSDSIFILNPAWRYTLVNESACSLTGVTRQNFLDGSMFDLFPGVETSPFFRSCQQVMETRLPAAVESKFSFPNGRYGWFEVRIFPVPQGILCVARDITAQKNTLLAEEEQNRLRGAVRKAQACYIAGENAQTTFDGILKTVLDLTASRLGFLCEVLLDDAGNRYSHDLAMVTSGQEEGSKEFLEKRDARNLEFHDLHTLPNMPLTTDELIISNQASSDPRFGSQPAEHPLIQAFMAIPMFFGGRLVGVLGLANRPGGYDKDLAARLEIVTSTCAPIIDAIQKEEARLQTQTGLEHSEARYRALVEQASDGIFLADRAGNLLEINTPGCALLGYTREEVFKLKVGDIIPLSDPTDFPTGSARLPIGTSFMRQRSLLRKDGTLLPVEINGKVLDDGNLQALVRDITGRKLAERQKEQNENRLRSLIEISQYDAKNTQDLLDFALHAALQLTGSKILYLYAYSEETRELTLSAWAKDISGEYPLHKPLERYRLEAAAEWGEPVRQRRAMIINDFQAAVPFKKKYPADPGMIKKFLSVPIFVNQAIVAVVGVANKDADYDDTDVLQLSLLMDSVLKIVEKRKAEELLHLQSAALNAAANAMIITDLAGAIQWANPAFTTLTGYSLAEVRGKNPRDLVRSGLQDAGYYRQMWAAILAGEVWHGELTNRRKDGTLYSEEMTITPVRDAQGQVNQFIAVKQDVTRKKEVEEALKRSEAKFRAIVENSHDGIIFCDAQAIISYRSPSYARINGFSDEERLGQSGFDSVHPEDMAEVRCWWSQVVEHPHQAFKTEYRIQHKNGSWVWVETTAQNLIDNPDVQEIVATSRDISEAKRAEEEKVSLLENAGLQSYKLNAIVHISSELRKAQTYEEVLPAIVNLSVEALQAGGGALLMVEDEDLHLPAAQGIWASSLGAWFPEIGPELWSFIRRAQPYLISSTASEPLFSMPDALTTFLKLPVSCALIPLKTRELVIGLLVIGYTTRQDFSSEQTSLISTIAEIAGNTLQRTRLMARMEQLVVNRNRELGTLYEVLSAASTSLDVRQSMQRALARTLQALNSQWGAICRVDETGKKLEVYVEENVPAEVLAFLERTPLQDTIEGQVLRQQEPLLISDMAFEKRMPVLEEVVKMPYSYLGVPMRVHGEVQGVLFAVRSLRPFSLDEITLLGSVTDHLALNFENARLRRLAEQTAVLEERSRLARDLHDSATQSLYSAALYADAALNLIETGDLEQIKRCLLRLSEINHMTLKDLRLLVYQLRPQALQEAGLAAALEQRLDSVERRVGTHAEMRVEGDLNFTPILEETLYWITTEALNNALRHASAHRVEIGIRVKDRFVELCVTDDGVGFDPCQPKPGGVGLISMRQRAEKMGGVFQVSSQPAHGATLTARIPLPDEHDPSL